MRSLGYVCVALILILGAGTAAAQEERPVVPVEMFGCKYQSGRSAANLDRANQAFNKWADSKGITGLDSLMLTPHFQSTEQEFEVVGMDIWQSGAVWGSGVTDIMGDESSVSGYTDALACPAHALFALVGIKAPQGEGTGGLLEFQNCTLKANRSADDGFDAIAAIADLAADWNLGDAYAVLFPVSGEAPDADYTFKWITYYPSVAAFGSLFDHYAAGAVQQANAIIDPVMSCDHSRMYDVETVRSSSQD